MPIRAFPAEYPHFHQKSKVFWDIDPPRFWVFGKIKKTRLDIALLALSFQRHAFFGADHSIYAPKTANIKRF